MSTETLPRYRLLDLQSGETTSGETITEIVDALLPVHGSIPDGEGQAAAQLEVREYTLAQIAQSAQATVCASADISSLDEDALTILFHDRHSEVPSFAEWASDLPLFLMASGYAPYTDRPRPSGDTIVFLDSHTERSFIDSLQPAGIAQLWVRENDSDF